jgi:hypothetical protein
VRVHRWPSIEVEVVSLALDPQNVRLDITERSQAAIIQDLFLNEEAFKLAESISRSGFFNNDLPVVTQEHGRYVVLEGNRRVAALKFMLAPHLVPRYESKLKSLLDSSDLSLLETIEVKVAPSREDADQLLASLHTTQARKSWSTLRQAYYYYAQIESGARTASDLAAAYPNVAIPTFITMWEMHQLAKSLPLSTPELEAAVAKKTFPITTFERIYVTDAFQEHFGITTQETGELLITSDPESLKESLAPLVEQIASRKVTSRTHNKEKAIKELISSMPTPKSDPSRPATTLGQLIPLQQPSNPDNTKRSTTLVPKYIVCELPAPALARRLDELQRLPYRKFPVTSIDAVRSLLECSLKAFCAEEKILPKRKGAYVYLNSVLIAVRDELQNRKKRTDLIAPLNKLISDSTPYSLLDQLNSANHNHHSVYSAEEIETIWVAIEPIVRFALNPTWD